MRIFRGIHDGNTDKILQNILIFDQCQRKNEKVTLIIFPICKLFKIRILVIFKSVWPSETRQWRRLATEDYPPCLHVWSRSVVLSRTKHLFFFHLITLTRMATSEKRISKVLLHILFLGCRLPFSSFFFLYRPLTRDTIFSSGVSSSWVALFNSSLYP